MSCLSKATKLPETATACIIRFVNYSTSSVTVLSNRLLTRSIFCSFLLMFNPLINFIRLLFFSLTMLLCPSGDSLVYICRVLWRSQHYLALPCWCLVSTVWALVIVLPFLFWLKWLSVHIFTCSWYLNYITVHGDACRNELTRSVTSCSLALHCEESSSIIVLDLEKLQLFSYRFWLLY